MRISTRVERQPIVARDATRRLDAVHLGHADVHQHDVGPFARHEIERGLPVLRLADHLDVRSGAQEDGEPSAHERLVVGDRDPDHVTRSSS